MKVKMGWGGLIAVIAVVVALVSLIGFLTSGFTNKDASTWFDKDRNEDNLIVAKYTDGETKATGVGINFTAKKNGELLIDGKATADTSFELCTLELPAGTYTLSGAPAGSLQTYYIDASYTNGSNTVQWYGDFSGKCTVTLTAKTTIKIVVRVMEGCSVNNAKVTPTLVKGDKTGDFYK